MKKFKDSVDDFFKWVKGTELVELDDIDVSEAVSYTHLRAHETV